VLLLVNLRHGGTLQTRHTKQQQDDLSHSTFTPFL
jgi:hypothetical protein